MTAWLVVKERHQRGALIVMKLSDFTALLGPLTDRAVQNETGSDYAGDESR
jgi:hypothetical protein